MDLDGITLPDELKWVDEFKWNSVSQSTGYSVTGALFVQESEKQKGRPITLVGTSELGWITRSVLDSLKTKRDTAGLQMTLTLADARTFNVMFIQETPLDVDPVLEHNSFSSEELFIVNSIKLMEV